MRLVEFQFTAVDGHIYRISVNADRVTTVSTRKNGKTSIQFSGHEDDGIMVDQSYEEVLAALRGGE